MQLRRLSIEALSFYACNALLSRPATERRGHLGQRKIRHDDVGKAGQRPVQLLALFLGNEQFDERARIQIDGLHPSLESPNSQPILPFFKHGLRQLRGGSAERPSHACARSGNARRRSIGANRATGRPRSVMTTSRPFFTSSSRLVRFCRSSRTPAVRISFIVSHVARQVPDAQ